VTTSESYSTTVQATLDIGGITDVFDVTTKAEVIADDPEPNQFSFTDKTNINLNSLTESTAITVTGINVASPISITIENMKLITVERGLALTELLM